VNIKILACQIIGPAAAGSAGPVPTALNVVAIFHQYCRLRMQANSVGRVSYKWCSVWRWTINAAPAFCSTQICLWAT